MNWDRVALIAVVTCVLGFGIGQHVNGQSFPQSTTTTDYMKYSVASVGSPAANIDDPNVTQPNYYAFGAWVVSSTGTVRFCTALEFNATAAPICSPASTTAKVVAGR
jgi:hypothetical protein